MTTGGAAQRSCRHPTPYVHDLAARDHMPAVDGFDHQRAGIVEIDRATVHRSARGRDRDEGAERGASSSIALERRLARFDKRDLEVELLQEGNEEHDAVDVRAAEIGQ